MPKQRFFLATITAVLTQSSSSLRLAAGSTQLKFSQQLRSAYHGWLLFLESLVLNRDMTQSNRQSVRWTLAWPGVKQDFLRFWKFKKKQKCNCSNNLGKDARHRPSLLTHYQFNEAVWDLGFFCFGVSSEFWGSAAGNIDSCKAEVIWTHLPSGWWHEVCCRRERIPTLQHCHLLSHGWVFSSHLHGDPLP